MAARGRAPGDHRGALQPQQAAARVRLQHHAHRRRGLRRAPGQLPVAGDHDRRVRQGARPEGHLPADRHRADVEPLGRHVFLQRPRQPAAGAPLLLDTWARSIAAILHDRLHARRARAPRSSDLGGHRAGDVHEQPRRRGDGARPARRRLLARPPGHPARPAVRARTTRSAWSTCAAATPARAEHVLRFALSGPPDNAGILANYEQALRGAGPHRRGRGRCRRTWPRRAHRRSSTGTRRARWRCTRATTRRRASLFLKELDRAPDYHEFHYALAVADFRLTGSTRRAREMALAMEDAVRRSDYDIYAAKLDRLKAYGGAAGAVAGAVGRGSRRGVGPFSRRGRVQIRNAPSAHGRAHPTARSAAARGSAPTRGSCPARRANAGAPR